jgi:hypothetical protein
LAIKYYNYNKFNYYIKYYLIRYNKETKIALFKIKPGLVPVFLEYLVLILVKYSENLGSNSNIKPENKYF